MQKLPLSLVSTYSYVNPVIAVLLGWLVLSEPLDWRDGAATAISSCGRGAGQDFAEGLGARSSRGCAAWRESAPSRVRGADVSHGGRGSEVRRAVNSEQ